VLVADDVLLVVVDLYLPVGLVADDGHWSRWVLCHCGSFLTDAWSLCFYPAEALPRDCGYVCWYHRPLSLADALLS
jgi:hypothetical protein